jgi:hypothetical protein
MKIKSGSITSNPTKLLEGSTSDQLGDRSAYLRSDNAVIWTGSALSFTSDIILERIHTASGTVGQHTILVASSPITLLNGESAWVLIDRTTTSETLTVNRSSVTPVPAHSAQNKDVIVLFRRVDVSGLGYLHVPLHKQVVEPGQTVRLGASGSGSGSSSAPSGSDLTSLNYRASVIDDLSDIDAVNTSAGFTDTSQFSSLHKSYALSYDASKTVTGQGTAIFVSATPAFTVKAGDVIAIGTEVRRITVASTPSVTTLSTISATGSETRIGSTGSGLREAVSTPFTVPAGGLKISSVGMYLKKYGGVTGMVNYKIRKDSAGRPSNAALDLMWTGADIDSSTLAGAQTLVTQTPNVILPAGNYHFLIEAGTAYAANVAVGGTNVAQAVNIAGTTGSERVGPSTWTDLTITAPAGTPPTYALAHVIQSINPDYTIESGFTVDPSASACCISQAVHTKDLNNYAGTGVAISSSITTALDQVLVDYEDNNSAGSEAPDFPTAHVAVVASVNGTSYSVPFIRPISVTTKPNAIGFNVTGSNLYLRFYANKSSGSGSVNLLGYKAFFHALQAFENGNLLEQAYCFTDGTGTPVNCSVSSASGLTRVTTTWTYTNGVNSGQSNGQLDVYLNGQKIPRFVDPTLTPDAYYKEISSTVIELDSDYSVQNYSIEVVKRIGVVDTSSTNSSRIAALEARPVSDSSGINYITGGNAESGTTGWIAYANGAAVPTTGTGGSPTLTFLQSGSAPLRGTYSFLTTPGALGNGAAYVFTISDADKAKILNISFDFAVSATTATGDYQVWIYDVTNSTLIQPSGYQLIGGVAGINYKHIATFQTASNSNSYRLLIHQAVATSTTLKLDNITVGPQVVEYGAPVTDWVSYTPTFGGFGTATGINFWWKRSGDSISIRGKWTAGTTTGAFATVSLPSGMTIDITRNPTRREVGTTTYWATSGQDWAVMAAGGDSAFTFGGKSGASNPATDVVGSTMASSSVVLSLNVVDLPITGFSSTVQMSNDTDTRVVSMYATKTGGANGGTAGLASFNTATRDTHGAFNATTGEYTVKVPGDYVSSLNVDWVTAQAIGFALFKNGAAVSGYGNSATSFYVSNSMLVPNCVAGDILTWRSSTASSVSVSAATVSFHRLSGPAAIAATEKVYLQYTGNAGTALTADVTNVDFATKVTDSHGAWTGTNTFTAPRAGWYNVSGVVQLTGSASNNYHIFVNGVKKYFIGMGNLASANKCFAGGTYLNAGDILTIRSDSSAVTLSNSSTAHWIAIMSQG